MPVELLAFPGIAAAVPGLVAGVTSRAGGVSRGAYASLNLGRSCGDEPDAVTENGRRLAAALGATERVRFPRQVHGREVVVLDAVPAGPLPDADAVVTAVVGLPVGVLGADCPGVLLADPVHRAIGVVHCGWRGTVAGVLLAAIEAMRTRFGTDPGALRVGLGPGISARRYEVGPDVAEPVAASIPGGAACLTPGRGDRRFLDLHEALRRQALAAGVPAAAIEAIALCTYDERDRFFSHRREGPATGRHGLVACLL